MKQRKQKVPFEQVVQGCSKQLFVSVTDTDVTLCLVAFSLEGFRPISGHVTNNRIHTLYE